MSTINEIEVKGVTYEIEDKKAREAVGDLKFSVNDSGILEITYGEE